jgi:hypothetical protein
MEHSSNQAFFVVKGIRRVRRPQSDEDLLPAIDVWKSKLSSIAQQSRLILTQT